MYAIAYIQSQAVKQQIGTPCFIIETLVRRLIFPKKYFSTAWIDARQSDGYTVVSNQIESFSSKWKLLSFLSPSFITGGRMEARKVALILMKNSHFDRTPQ